MTELPADIGDFVEGLPPRRESGIYFLLIGQTIVYVGQAADIRKRIGNHLTEGVKEFDRFSWLPFPQKELDRREREFIGRYVPRYNRCQLANNIRLMREAGWSGAGENLGLPRCMPVDDAARYLGLTREQLEALGDNGPPYRNQRYARARAKRKVYTLQGLQDYARSISNV